MKPENRKAMFAKLDITNLLTDSPSSIKRRSEKLNFGEITDLTVNLDSEISKLLHQNGNPDSITQLMKSRRILARSASKALKKQLL